MPRPKDVGTHTLWPEDRGEVTARRNSLQSFDAITVLTFLIFLLLFYCCERSICLFPDSVVDTSSEQDQADMICVSAEIKGESHHEMQNAKF